MNIEFIKATSDLFKCQEQFENGVLKSVPYSAERERCLAKSLAALADAYGVRLKTPLHIDVNGEFSIVAQSDDPLANAIGGCGEYGSFAQILNRHSPRTGTAPGARLDEKSGWCRMNHFEAEKMVKSVYHEVSHNFILAEAHTDDHTHNVTFNAIPYFEKASEQDIYDLADCGWGGDYPADYVAEYLDGRDPDVTEFFLNKHAGPKQGFECHIDQTTALAWLKINHPDLRKALLARGEMGEVVQEQASSKRPMP